MRASTTISGLALSGLALAAPYHTSASHTSSTPSATWQQTIQTDFPIHSSCNATERRILSRGLDDARIMAQNAKDHILRLGRDDPHYIKYFGNASTAAAIGWYDRIVNADKTGNWFRCDDPDGNCHQKGWGGHWRGENATEETVICPLSYHARFSLDYMCGLGYDVANGKLNVYWASDLIHRMLHLPNIAEGVVDHYADDYVNVTALAEENPDETVNNSETLQLFALSVYAFDVALPGEGCEGVLKETSSSSAAVAAATSTGSVAAAAATGSSTTNSAVGACVTQADGMVLCQAAEQSTSAASSAQATQAPTDTTSASAECHTHSDGVVHCD